jgi:putative AlgH/UPF0301 family transcriptional regulator
MKWLSLAIPLSPLCVWMAQGQSMRQEDLGAGKILVASRELPDPNFAKSIVLLVQYDEDGVLGLIVNRRSKVPVSRVLDDEAAKDRPDPIYAGGPVEKAGVMGLLRANDKPGDAKRVFGDVYLISSKDLLEKTLASPVESNAFHIYLGYAGWTVGQLEHEVDLGAWFIFRGDAAAVFDSDPDTLWSRLIRETELHIAAVVHR